MRAQEKVHPNGRLGKAFAFFWTARDGIGSSISKADNFHNVGCAMSQLTTLWSGEEGQDIAEYAVMLAVILVLVIGTIRIVGGNANNVFSNVASNIQ